MVQLVGCTIFLTFGKTVKEPILMSLILRGVWASCMHMLRTIAGGIGRKVGMIRSYTVSF